MILVLIRKPSECPFDGIRVLPDVECAGERLPGTACKYEDRFSQGAGKGRKEELEDFISITTFV